MAVCDRSPIRQDCAGKVVAPLTLHLGREAGGTDGSVVRIIESEVSSHHLRGGDERLQHIGVARILQESFITAPDENFPARSWNGAAAIAARIVVMRISFGDPLVVILPIVGVQGIIAGIEVRRAVVICCARFADSAYHYRAILRISSEIGGLYADLLRHLRADDRYRARHVSRIDDID